MKYLTFITLALFLYSCQNHSNKPQSAEEAQVQKRDIDTLHFKDQVVYLEPIDSNEFLRLPLNSLFAFDLDSTEKIDDTLNVYRRDSILVLRFDNGDSVKLVSAPNSTNDTLVLVYRYGRYLRSLNSYFVLNNFYEGAYYSLWNKSSGKQTGIFGNPTVSPDRKTLLCYSLDILAQFSPNGFQLFSVGEDNSLNILWQRETWWGPNECRWKDNQTICFKADYLDSTSTVKTKYFKLTLPDFTK